MWFWLVHLLLQVFTVRGKVPAIIVFGDSSVDSGNNNHVSTVLKSNFAPYGRDFYDGKPTGRFSNGRIPTDFISEAFGNKPIVPAYLDPTYDIKDFATGVCFASAGTGYDNATSDVLVSCFQAMMLEFSRICIHQSIFRMNFWMFLLNQSIYFIFSLTGLAVCNTSLEGVGVLQRIPGEASRISRKGEG